MVFQNTCTQCSDTYGDLLPLLRFKHSNPTTLLIEVPQTNLRPGFLQLTVAHINGGYVVPLLCCHTAVASDRIVSATAVPLPRMDLELSHRASVEDEGSCLVVLVTPAQNKLDQMGRSSTFNLNIKNQIKLSGIYKKTFITCHQMK